MSKQKTPVDFCRNLLEAWAYYFVEKGLYKESGMDYGDALALAWMLQNDPMEENYDTLKSFHNLIGKVLKAIEEKEKKNGTDSEKDA